MLVIVGNYFAKEAALSTLLLKKSNHGNVRNHEDYLGICTTFA
jgi:hypothetical protein